MRVLSFMVRLHECQTVKNRAKLLRSIHTHMHYEADIQRKGRYSILTYNKENGTPKKLIDIAML